MFYFCFNLFISRLVSSDRTDFIRDSSGILTSFFKLRRPNVPWIAENWLSKSSGLKYSEHRWEVGVNVHFARLTRTKLIHSRLLFASVFFWKFVLIDVLWRVWSTAQRWLSWLSIGLSRVKSWVRLRPDQHSGSLNNLRISAAFVITLANG